MLGNYTLGSSNVVLCSGKTWKKIVRCEEVFTFFFFKRSNFNVLRKPYDSRHFAIFQLM